MKFIIITCLCVISLEFSQGAEEIHLSDLFQGTGEFDLRELPQGATNERCDRLSDFVTKALATFKKLYPEITDLLLRIESEKLGFDVNSESARRPVLCKIADAKTLRDLSGAMAIDITDEEDYGRRVAAYKRIRNMVSSSGGYTNVERVMRSKQDTEKWTEQLKPGQNLKEMTDLASLTDFLNIMQVKYGSRWLAAPLYVENQSFLIEDPEDFAKKLYDCETTKDVMTAFSLDERKASRLKNAFEGDVEDRLPPKEIVDIFIEGTMLLGDMGLFNLKF